MARKKATKKTCSKKELSKPGLLKDFWGSLPDAAYLKDTKGRFVLVNDAYAKTVGLEPKQIVGKTDFDLFPPQEAKKMAKADEAVMKSGKPTVDKIQKGIRRGCHQQYVSVTKVPRYGKKGKVVGLIGVIRDATKCVKFESPDKSKADQAKKLKMVKDLDKDKSEFIAAISHELRSPMAVALQLFLLIFDETAGPVNEKQREILVRMRYNMDRLKKMVDNLLDLSVMEGKRLKLHYSLANLNDLLMESRDFFQQKAAEKDVKLKYYLPKRDVCIFVDGERIVQVISNLLNNAIKFTKKNGSIRVEVKLLEDKVRIGIIDTGIGIPESGAAKMFDKFVQLSNDNEVEKKGIGMGLSIVKEIVEKHDGEVWAESKLGIGTKFYFTLPRFYTANLPPRQALDRIDKFLVQGISVYVVNVRIINYKEFVKRMSANASKILEDFRGVITKAIKVFFEESKATKRDVISDTRYGRYTIILPEVGEAKVSKFCVFLRTMMKEYFSKHKIGNVFVVLGISTFASKEQRAQRDGEKYPYVTIREVYVGPEVRRYKRINYEGGVEVVYPDKTVEIFPFADLSQGGLCFMSAVGSEKFKVDMIVETKFNLIKKKKAVVTRTRVAWIKKIERLPGARADQYKIGVEFYKIKSQDQNLLTNELKLYYD